MAGKIIIDTERCKGCGLCVTICPRQSISISNKTNKAGYFPAETSNRDCTGCAMCAIICPDVAIEVHLDSDQAEQITTRPKQQNSAKCDKQKGKK